MTTTGIQSQNEACLLTLKCKNTNDETRTILHELGRSFGLAHTYLLESEQEDCKNRKMEKFENPYYLHRAKTDNIMDYTFVDGKQMGQFIDNPYKGKMFSLFKWQWDKMTLKNRVLKNLVATTLVLRF